MRYVVARIEEYERDLAYRIYLTDSIYLYARNKALTKRYIDIVNGIGQNEDEVDADELAMDVIKRAGLTVVDDGGTDD